MEHTYYDLFVNKVYFYSLYACVFLMVVAGLLAGYIFLQPKSRPSCQDFGSYTDAKQALKPSFFYPQGMYWLDSDKDGRPCVSTFPKEAARDHI